MFELALRAAVILAVAWAVAQCLRRATAATRHLVWHCAIVAVLAAPLLSPLAPRFKVSGVPLVPAVLHMPAAQDTRRQSVRRTSRSDSAGPGGTFATPSAFGPFGTLRTLGTLVWAIASVILSLWFALGWVSSALMARRARPAPGAWQLEVNALGERLRITREVRLRIVEGHTSPLAVGLWKSTILLPATAATWEADRRRAVLLHELAHIRRADCRVQVLAQAACALYWFNPLVWTAFARLRSERERACDDEVLRNGAQPSSYAAHLLDIARDLRPTLRPSAALGMARPSELEGRLLAVLAAGRARVPARGSRWAIAITVGVATVAALGATPVALSTTAPTVAPLASSPRAFYTPFNEPPAPADRDTIRPLQAALNDGDQDVREKAALALALMSGPDVIPALLKALSDPDAQVREKAAIGLALRRDPRVVDALLAAMGDPDSQVREKVAIALGTSGDARAVPALERGLQDSNSQVREKAVTGLLLLRITRLDQ